MIALEVEFLTGRYVATSFNDRDAPEWPPHPARLFSALVATAQEHEELASQAEEALAWLERQGPPDIQASDAEARSPIPTFVPENATRVLTGWSTAEEKLDEARRAVREAQESGDQKALTRAQKALSKAEGKLAERMTQVILDDGRGNDSTIATAREMLPESRGKQPRMLPSVTPHIPSVRYTWMNAAPEAHVGETLSELGRRLVRLGHSSSFVKCRVVQEPLQSEDLGRVWKPTARGGTRMRTVEEGQLMRLSQGYERHRGVEPRVLPAVHQAYAIEGEEQQLQAPRSVFGDWIVLREIPGETGRRVGLKLSRTEDITRAIRGALLSHAEEPIPPVLSGHDAEGRPLQRPHVAFVPLADVGSRYASGNVLGIAVLLPDEIQSDERRSVLRAIGRWEQSGLRLTLGRIGALHLERVVDRDPRRTLDPAFWTQPARRWASVTPVALDKNPGNLHSRDPQEVTATARRAEEIVMRSCENIGLPAPRWVEIVRRSLFDPAPAARHYMPFPRKSASGNSPRRVCVHVEICFEEPVAGPVLIGAGRYFGLGLCRGRD